MRKAILSMVASVALAAVGLAAPQPGTGDPGFNFLSVSSRIISSLALQADGKILMAGGFTNVITNGNPMDRRGVARLNADGGFDPGFDAGVDVFGYARPPNDPGGVGLVLVQPDGKILVADMAQAKKSLRALFDEASEIETEQERQAYLDQACGEDATLRARVDRLLRAEARAGRFLADPQRQSASPGGGVQS